MSTIKIYNKITEKYVGMLTLDLSKEDILKFIEENKYSKCRLFIDGNIDFNLDNGSFIFDENGIFLVNNKE